MIKKRYFLIPLVMLLIFAFHFIVPYMVDNYNSYLNINNINNSKEFIKISRKNKIEYSEEPDCYLSVDTGNYNNSDIEFTLAFLDGSNCSEYIYLNTFDFKNDESQEIILERKFEKNSDEFKNFNQTIQLKAYVKNNPTIFATCDIDCVKKIDVTNLNITYEGDSIGIENNNFLDFDSYEFVDYQFVLDERSLYFDLVGTIGELDSDIEFEMEVVLTDEFLEVIDDNGLDCPDDVYYPSNYEFSVFEVIENCIPSNVHPEEYLALAPDCSCFMQLNIYLIYDVTAEYPGYSGVISKSYETVCTLYFGNADFSDM